MKTAEQKNELAEIALKLLREFHGSAIKHVFPLGSRPGFLVGVTSRRSAIAAAKDLARGGFRIEKIDAPGPFIDHFTIHAAPVAR